MVSNVFIHTGGFGDLDFLTEGLGGINVGGVAPMGGLVGGLGGTAPFATDPGLSDLFALQTGPLVTGGGPVVLPKQASYLLIC